MGNDRRSSRGALAFGVLLGCGACASPPDPPAAPESIEEAVEWIGTLRLEETAASQIAAPNLRVDHAGGWLYWDGRLDEARRYREDGSLAGGFGRHGDGPGEFNGLTGLARLTDGRLATADRRGRLAIWSEAGELLEDVDTGLHSIRGFVALPGNRVAILLPPGQDGNSAHGLILRTLHIDAGAAGSTLFSGPLATEYLPVAYAIQPPGPRVHGDEVHVALAVLDSVWAVPLSETGASRVFHLRASSRDRPPLTGPGAAAGGIHEWLATAVFVGDFARLSDESWVVGTWRRVEDEVRYGLRRFDADGTLLWELEDSPRLLEADAEDRLYFSDPSSLDPANILIARLRR